MKRVELSDLMDKGKETSFTEGVVEPKKVEKKVEAEDVKFHKIFDVRQGDSGFTFNVEMDNESIIKNAFLPMEIFETMRESVLRKEKMAKKERRKKIMEFAVIYPGGVISLIYIIHSVVQIYPKIMRILSVGGF